MSINSRVEKGKLLPCMFGYCILFLLNWAVTAQRTYPSTPILASKIGYKSVYKRKHINTRVAMQTCTQLPEEDIVIIALCLTFGGSHGPYKWGVLSKSICDLANTILKDMDWDSDSLFLPIQHLVPPKSMLPLDMPFGKAEKQIVDILIDPRENIDVYIDNAIGLTVNLPGSNNVTRLERAALLAMHTTAHLLSPEELLPRDKMASLSKLAAEDQAEEHKMILGWRFDFRALLVSLPENKHTSWSNAIITMLQRGHSHAKELETNIGWYVHTSIVLPHIHHFLSKILDFFACSKTDTASSSMPQSLRIFS
eukprot:15365526-Ditylum_brightwellii.AAC.1